MKSRTLIIEFSGRCMMRQPTDPEPYDENRGTSGYTFAYGDEPNLNRVIYFHEDPDFPLRSHCPPIGVHVDRAYVQQLVPFHEVEALKGARFDLLGNPVLENRNWALTRPGYEPIVPFHLRISSADERLVIDRMDVLDTNRPDDPVWKLPLKVIENKGARGLAYEPATVGAETGVYDGYYIAKARLAQLREDRDRLPPDSGDDPVRAILDGRIYELEIGVNDWEAGTPNRRTSVYPLIERFGYFISGKEAYFHGDPDTIYGELNLAANCQWRIDFWIGGWDPDALCAFTKGTLQIPYTVKE